MEIDRCSQCETLCPISLHSPQARLVYARGHECHMPSPIIPSFARAEAHCISAMQIMLVAEANHSSASLSGIDVTAASTGCRVPDLSNLSLSSGFICPIGRQTIPSPIIEAFKLMSMNSAYSESSKNRKKLVRLQVAEFWLVCNPLTAWKCGERIRILLFGDSSY